ncbi:pyridoxal phosphate-dependent aminotransferase [Halobacteriales archaeon QS_8_69_26]|nr:MAG: pyridoxal phosphate-dependent aminotransferase [Halobacteriales archaeon QS_8_69_26]
MFPRIDYLHWIEGRPDAATYDLGSSDLRGSGPLQEGPVPDRLADLPDPPDDVDLEGQVADEYGVGRESVLLAPGASVANVVALAAALNLAVDADAAPGEPTVATGESRVLVEKPGYEPLLETPRGLGANVDRFLRRAGDDYRLDSDRIRAAVVEDTALTVVTNRHNPSGNLADRDTLAAAAEAARSEGAYLLVDEVYAPFVDPADAGTVRVGSGADSGPTGGAFGGPTAAGIDGAVVTGSLTKFHGLGGLRVGWVVADPEFVEAARVVAAHVPGFSEPGRVLGRRAFAAGDRLAEEARSLLRENAALLAEFVDGRDDLSGPVFDGATYAFLDHDRADGDAVAAAAEERDLLVVPGRFFQEPGRFRVSLGRDPDHVADALDVLGETLDAR